jgi:hypothetical protein
MRRPGVRFVPRVLAFSALALLLAACSSIGPRTMDRDQLNYGASIGNNWKNQMLLNIVRTRYFDMPVFVDVTSIVSGYSLETQVNAAVGFGDSFTGGDSQGLGAGGRFTDRPTISYVPKTGDEYLRSLLMPVEPKNLLALIQVGYNAELLFTWAIESINGLKNYTVTDQSKLQIDPEFYEFTQLVRKLQLGGVIAWELEHDPETAHDVLLVLNRPDPGSGLMQDRLRVAELLGLDPTLERYRVLYAPVKLDDSTLSLQTRSVMQMLAALSGFVEVPSGLASHTVPGFVMANDAPRPFHVFSATERPEQSFAAARYGDYWYWIENTDLPSKRVFTLMLFLTTLTNRASDDDAPVLTIPTG